MIGIRKGLAALAIAALATVGTGCSSNPPCETDIAAVEAARQAAEAAEAKYQAAQREKQQREQDPAAKPFPTCDVRFASAFALGTRIASRAPPTAPPSGALGSMAPSRSAKSRREKASNHASGAERIAP